MKSSRFTLAVVVIGLLPNLGLSPRLVAEDVDGQKLYEKVVKSAVYILTPLTGGHAEGSGSLIDVEQKLVVTNYHVVEDQNKVFVIFPIYKDGELMTDKQEYKRRVVNKGLGIKGTVLCRDKKRDLAIVKVDSVPKENTAIPLATKSPRPATPVWQIGNAGKVSHAFRMSRGDVSAVGHFKGWVGDPKDGFELNCTMITATNPTTQGDSGGPLYDRRGYQVGVTESGLPSANLVNNFVDVTEIWALLKEQKIKVKEPPDEPEPKKEEPKTSVVPITPKTARVDPPAKKEETAPLPPPKTEDVTAPSAADEKAAADKLKNAKLFANGDDNRETFIAKLTEIVKKWPNTAAGKEAKKLLGGLK